MEWATLPLKKYADFSGRARRKEFWSFFLLMVVASVVAGLVDGLLGMSRLIGGVYGPVTFLAALFFVTPQFSVGIRRLHDIDRSGWWILLSCVPIAVMVMVVVTGAWTLGLLNLVALVLLYFFVLEGSRGANRFGPDPKDAERAPAPAA